jgi:sRNA-binding regulator protein Hfq
MTRNWGQDQTTYLAALGNQRIKVVFLDGKVIRGTLSGVDRYEIFVKPARGPEVLVCKGALKYVQPLEGQEGQA